MGRLANDIRAKLEADPAQLEFFKANGNVKFVFDHVSYHDRAESMLQANGWGYRVPTPPWSPDFNRVVEHTHGVVKKAFRQSRTPLPVGDRMQVFMDRIKELVEEHVRVESIAKDVATLDLLWKVVAANPDQWVRVGNKMERGVAGNWPPGYMR